MQGLNRDGFNREGYDAEGFDKEGRDKCGYDRRGLNKEGFDRDGLDKDGYDKTGYDKVRATHSTYFAKQLLLHAGCWHFGRQRGKMLAAQTRFSRPFCRLSIFPPFLPLSPQEGRHRDGLDKDGFDPFGFDAAGLNMCVTPSLLPICLPACQWQPLKQFVLAMPQGRLRPPRPPQGRLRSLRLRQVWL